MASSGRRDVYGLDLRPSLEIAGADVSRITHRIAGRWGSGGSGATEIDPQRVSRCSPGATETDLDAANTTLNSHRGWSPRPNGEPEWERFGPWQSRQPSRAREGKALASVIEEDVIPRLVMAHRRTIAAPNGRGGPRLVEPGPATPSAVASNLVTPDIEAFGHSILNKDMDRAMSIVDTWCANGSSLEDICAGLLQPAASLLESYCAGDAIDFADLTLGLGRLQWVLHDLERICGEDAPLGGLDRRILLAAVPAERHTFGVSMLSTVFHRAGWDVSDALLIESFESLVGMVRTESYPMVGLWVGGSCRMSGLAEGIDAVRRSSINPDMKVLMAGPVFGGNPSGVAINGADAVADTAPAAVHQAERLLDRALGRH